MRNYDSESVSGKGCVRDREPEVLEHFHKSCSHSVGKQPGAVFLGFGFVSAQSQGCCEPAPSPKPRQNPKILAPNGYRISSNATVAGPSAGGFAGEALQLENGGGVCAVGAAVSEISTRRGGGVEASP